MMEMNKMTRNEKKQRRIRQLKIRVISTLLIFCLVIVAGGCALIEKNKESKKVVRVNGGVVEKTKNVADNSENTSTETKEETTKDNKRVIDPNKPMIALTFDDGPGERTLELLETLEKYNVRASFFMCGTSLSRNDIKVEEILKKMDELGCDMGNHTMDHQSLPTLSSKKIKWEVEGVNDLIKKHVGHGAKFVRPPYGAGIRDKKVSKYVKAPMVCWSVDTLDWKTKSKKETIRSVMNDAHDGDIVLMHDIHGWTVDAVKKIIPKLLKKGYQLVTVSEMAEAKGCKLENGKPYFEF
jgi:peptidoglycan/xylan/chitin deacetylase (PgdA/CDA1 family)